MDTRRWQAPPNPAICGHSIGENVAWNRFLETISSSSCSGLECLECQFNMSLPPKKKKEISDEGYLWVCLDCEQIFCGGESSTIPRGHIHSHAIDNDHQMAVPIAAWCFHCNSMQRALIEEVMDLNNKMKSTSNVMTEGLGMVQEKISGMQQEETFRTKKEELLRTVQKELCFTGYSVRRMKNLGNTCFFNSILQNLLSMNLLRDNIMKLNPVVSKPITDSLWKLFTNTSSATDDKLIPVDLLHSIGSKVPHFEGNQQQDSHELLIFLRNLLLEEGTSCIDAIFGGVVSSTMSCLQCGNVSTSSAPFHDLSLPIPSIDPSTNKDEVDTPKDVVPPNRQEDVEDNLPDTTISMLLSKNKKPTVLAANPHIKTRTISRRNEVKEVEDPKEKDGDIEDCCDSGEVDVLLESQKKDSIIEVVVEEEEEDPEEVEEEILTSDVEDEHSLKAEKIPAEKLSPQNANLDSEVKPLMQSASKASNSEGVKGQVYSRKRPRHALHIRFANSTRIQSDDNNDDAKSTEKCFDNTSGDAKSTEKCLDNTSNDALSTEKCLDNMSDDALSTEKCLDNTNNDALSTEKCLDNTNADYFSIEKCLDLFTEPVTVSGGCEHCKGGHTERIKRELISKAPPILTVHFKRFRRDTHGITSKIIGHISFPDVLDIAPYLDPSCEDKEKSLYRLIGVVDHEGSSMNAGHYIAFVRGVLSVSEQCPCPVLSQSNGTVTWFRTSDCNVWQSSLGQVLECEAYILFYERM